MKTLNTILAIAGAATIFYSCTDNAGKHIYTDQDGNKHQITFVTRENLKTGKNDSVLLLGHITGAGTPEEKLIDTIITKKYDINSKKHEISKIEIAYVTKDTANYTIYEKKDTTDTNIKDLFLLEESLWSDYLSKINPENKILEKEK